MYSNYHTHTTYCDGKSCAEEIVLAAIDKGMTCIGFSGHGFTEYDTRYCMKDTEGYIAEIHRLQEKYKDSISVLCGVEEDAFAPCDRDRFDYIIGSCHYLKIGTEYYPIDSSCEHMKRCIELYGGNTLALAGDYYESFTRYILQRKPDIIGHFDLITKFDETDSPLFLGNKQYTTLSERYISLAAGSGCAFEVNTGAISRGYRRSPYPYESLLYILKTLDSPIVLSSDSHSKDTLDFHFDETVMLLRDIGFKYICEIRDGRFARVKI